MKTQLLMFALTALVFSPKAQALTSCAGLTAGGAVVTVKVVTAGSTGSAQSALVAIAGAGETPRSFAIKKEEISQFFESSSDDGKRAVTGLSAYVGGENPVSIRYSGSNFQDDLMSVLHNPQRVKETGNEMRIWKGPGFPADQQLQAKDVVCQVFLQLP